MTASRGELCACGATQPTGGCVDGGQGASAPAGRRHPLADPSRVLRLAADLLTSIRLEPFTSQQAQLSARWLRRSRHGPYIDLLQPAFPSLADSNSFISFYGADRVWSRL